MREWPSCARLQKILERLQHTLGCFGHERMACGQLDHLGLLAQIDQALRRFRWRHLVGIAQHKQGGAGHLRHSRFCASVVVAGLESGVEHIHLSVAGQHPAHQRFAAAIQPGAGAQGRRRWCQSGVREAVDHVNRLERGADRQIEQGGRHAHGVGRAHHHQVPHAGWVRHCIAGSGFEGNERAKAVADQRGFFNLQCIEQRDDGVGRFFNALGWVAFAFAVPGQVNGQHVPSVVGHVAGLQNPDAVVVEHAVDEHGGGLRGVEGLAAGVGIERVGGQWNVHGGWNFKGPGSGVCPC